MFKCVLRAFSHRPINLNWWLSQWDIRWVHFDLQSLNIRHHKSFSVNSIPTHLILLQIRLSFWRLVLLVWSCGRSHKLSRAPPRWWWVSFGGMARRTCWCKAWGLPWTDARGNLCVNCCWRARYRGAYWADPAEPSPASPLPDHRGKVASQSYRP